jgi:hypothetical protein
VSEQSPAWATEDRRLKRWINSVGTVTLPLLAGFSITSVVVVSDDPKYFWWPGLTILVLTIAALALIVAVQCAYHAHLYLSKRDPERGTGLRWARRTRFFYDLGLSAMLAGLALVVVPNPFAGRQAGFRWAAVLLAGVICLIEIVWKLRESTTLWVRGDAQRR